jgi:outer membrane protein insertion porin family
VRTKASTIAAALRFKEGDLFNPQKILESQTPLRKLNVFDAVSLETLGLKGKEDVVHVVVRMEERKHKLIDLGLTYDTDTGFKAKITLARLNLLGRAKEFDFKVTGGNQFDRAEFGYIDPRFFGSDWQFLTNVFVQFERRPFFQDFQGGGSVGVLRDITRQLSILTRYEFVRTDFVESKTNFALLSPDQGTQDNTLGKLQFNVTYDKRDNFGDPRSGYYLGGLENFETQFQGQGGLSNFFKLNARFGYWYSPFRRFTIANALRIGWIIPLHSDDIIPTQELYFLGGDDTIRGFKEDAVNPAGGKLAIVYNLELQMRLFKGFELVGFTDMGSDTNSFSEINLGTIRNSAGAGIRYVTPVGPIRLDYGIILDRESGENFGRLHFTFGFFF